MFAILQKVRPCRVFCYLSVKHIVWSSIFNIGNVNSFNILQCTIVLVQLQVTVLWVHAIFGVLTMHFASTCQSKAAHCYDGFVKQLRRVCSSLMALTVRSTGNTTAAAVITDIAVSIVAIAAIAAIMVATCMACINRSRIGMTRW